MAQLSLVTFFLLVRTKEIPNVRVTVRNTDTLVVDTCRDVNL